ncbi:MAG: EF-hand domain-containing protein [Myxococcales bacterium]|nr:EF-hand domain-containing protein [Myxococcales bacterium]
MAAKKTKQKPVKTRKPAAKAKKPVAKKPAPKKVLAKKPAVRAAAPKPTKKKGTPRNPPMHARVNHPELDDDEHEEVFEIFKVYDRDGSGSIDRSEFARLLEALGMAPGEEELSIALDVVDANHSGKISWDEFQAWWTNR